MFLKNVLLLHLVLIDALYWCLGHFGSPRMNIFWVRYDEKSHKFEPEGGKLADNFDCIEDDEIMFSVWAAARTQPLIDDNDYTGRVGLVYTVDLFGTPCLTGQRLHLQDF